MWQFKLIQNSYFLVLVQHFSPIRVILRVFALFYVFLRFSRFLGFSKFIFFFAFQNSYIFFLALQKKESALGLQRIIPPELFMRKTFGLETWHKCPFWNVGFLGKCKEFVFLFTNHEIANNSKTRRSNRLFNTQLFKRERSSQRFYISLFSSPTEVIWLQIDSIDSNRFNRLE